MLMYCRDASLNTLGIVLEGCISQYIRRVSQSKLKRSPEMSWTRTHRLYILLRDASLTIVLEGCISYVNVLEGCISQYIRRVSQSKLKRSSEMSWTRTQRLYIHLRDASLTIVLEGCISYVNVL